MGSIFEVIMTKEQLKMKIILKWCDACEWCADDYHRLFSQIYNYHYYARLRLQTENEKVYQQAKESLELTIADLDFFMTARCFPDYVKRAVWLVCKTL